MSVWHVGTARSMHSLIRRFVGGYKSNQQGTQEESLCRRSNLACGLESLEYPIPALGAAWVPDVCVFRADERAGYQLLETPFWIGGVIACALRNFRSDTEKDLEFVRQKIETVLAVAASQGHTSLVLGAWGCGAFGNDAPLVARLFAEALRLANGIFAGPNLSRGWQGQGRVSALCVTQYSLFYTSDILFEQTPQVCRSLLRRALVLTPFLPPFLLPLTCFS